MVERKYLRWAREVQLGLGAVLVYSVVSAETEKAVEVFVRRGDAERFPEDVRVTTPS